MYLGACEITILSPTTRYPNIKGVAVPNATHGNASGSVTLTTAKPPNIEMPGLCPANATYEPMFIPLGAPVFATAAVASMIDPDAAEWVNGAAADILDTEKPGTKDLAF
jgi:hypothetical protein